MIAWKLRAALRHLFFDGDDDSSGGGAWRHNVPRALRVARGYQTVASVRAVSPGAASNGRMCG